MVGVVLAREVECQAEGGLFVFESLGVLVALWLEGLSGGCRVDGGCGGGGRGGGEGQVGGVFEVVDFVDLDVFCDPGVELDDLGIAGVGHPVGPGVVSFWVMCCGWEWEGGWWKGEYSLVCCVDAVGAALLRVTRKRVRMGVCRGARVEVCG